MYRIILLGLVTVLAAGAAPTKDATTGVSIIVAEDATLPEHTAARELADYLSKATGSTFPIVNERDAKPAQSGIYVGHTKFSEANGVDFSTLGPEEWVLRSKGESLIVAGGRPRGALYAVYHFIEDRVGVHWWNPYEEFVPKTSGISLSGLDRREAPTFRYRDIYMLYGGDRGRFAARNRLNRDGDSGIAPDYGGAMNYGPPYHVHTFYAYIPPSQYFTTHPEWFSLINGQRDANMKQLCLTNKELRDVFVQKLKAYITQARAEAEKSGQPAPTVFDISQNDWEGMCQCDACQAITKAEESEAGPLLDFLNYIADAIKDEYPGVYIDSLAYMMTQKPPKTIRPRDNIILRLCDTGSNFTKPITDPENKAFHDHLLSWAAITKNLRIWNYAVTYAPYYGLPLPTVQTYPVNYQFYAAHNVEGVFTEHEYPILADMRDFKVWMMMKTLENPSQDYGILVRTFTDGFYGPAGAFIRQYLDTLETASSKHSSYLSMGASPRQYHYLNMEFVSAANTFFDQAEEAVSDDAILLRRVRFARLPLDRAILVLFRDLNADWAKSGNDAAAFPLNRDAVAKRCRDTWSAQIEFRLSPGDRPTAMAEMERELTTLCARPANVALPEQFRGLPPGTIFDYTADVSRNWADQAKRVADPEAESGLTNRLELSDEEMKRYALPMPWGLYDVINKKHPLGAVIRAEDVPGPGYHWYRLGEFPIGPSYYLYFFWSWVIQVDLENAVDPANPGIKYEIWSRIKFEGPAFPYGKPEQKNAISVERVILKTVG